MELLTLLSLVIVCVIIVWYTQKGSKKIKVKTIKANKPLDLNELKKVIDSEFRKFTVRVRLDQLMICEVDHRGTLEELVFIRLEKNAVKSVVNKGRFIIATYPYMPSASEMRKDFSPVLSKY